MMPPEFTRYQKLIIYVFQQERTVPKTILAIERMTQEKYNSPGFIRAVVRRYKDFVNGRPTPVRA
jgi:hypothetical protein